MTRTTFRQADVRRALKAAASAGVEADEVRIEPGGAIRIIIHRGHSESVSDVRREIESHFHGKL